MGVQARGWHEVGGKIDPMQTSFSYNFCPPARLSRIEPWLYNFTYENISSQQDFCLIQSPSMVLGFGKSQQIYSISKTKWLEKLHQGSGLVVSYGE